MAFGVFIHRHDSIYEDIPSEKYQFPKQYLSRAKNCEGDWVIYLEPSKVKKARGYFAIAKVKEIISDSQNEGMFLAIIEKGSYLDFGDPVQFSENGEVIEQGLLNNQGKISGRSQAAVRTISAPDFTRILDNGLFQDDNFLPRAANQSVNFGFHEDQAPFEVYSSRVRVEQLTNRAIRDRNFRKTVLKAYEERCAITGLRLINGGGRAEVEAAHIRPVEHKGPDIVSNGIALSGTAHWMFDRGLVGLSNELKILVSRHTNDPSAVRAMINQTGHLIAPERAFQRPRNEFINWHRQNCFKN